jgi:DNA-directed RNA polymerase subunit RPC12/RpoP
MACHKCGAKFNEEEAIDEDGEGGDCPACGCAVLEMCPRCGEDERVMIRVEEGVSTAARAQEGSPASSYSLPISPRRLAAAPPARPAAQECDECGYELSDSEVEGGGSEEVSAGAGAASADEGEVDEDEDEDDEDEVDEEDEL